MGTKKKLLLIFEKWETKKKTHLKYVVMSGREI